MNPSPRLHGKDILNSGCGRQALRNVETAFWQSRMTTTGQRAEPIRLVDLRELAKEIRRK